MSHDPSIPNLLADLESRQDELLRLLTELEERTKQALAALTAPSAPTSNSHAPNSHAPNSTVMNSTAPSILAASIASQSGSEPNIRAVDIADANVANVAAEKPSRASARSRSRKAA